MSDNDYLAISDALECGYRSEHERMEFFHDPSTAERERHKRRLETIRSARESLNRLSLPAA